MDDAARETVITRTVQGARPAMMHATVSPPALHARFERVAADLPAETPDRDRLAAEAGYPRTALADLVAGPDAPLPVPVAPSQSLTA